MEETINQRFEIIRNILKLSQKELSKILGTSQASISDIERGRTMPNHQIIFDFNKKFGVSFDWIYTGKGDIFISLPDTEMNTDFVPRVHTKEGVNTKFEMEAVEYINRGKGTSEILSKGLTWMIFSSYNKKKGTDFNYNSFLELSRIFYILATYADLLQQAVEVETLNEVLGEVKKAHQKGHLNETVIPEEVERIIDKYIDVYNNLKSAATDGMITIENIDGIIKILRDKIKP